MEEEKLKDKFLETLHDLSLSVAYLRNKDVLPFEIKKIACECKISTAEAYETLERAKRENWRRK